MYMNWFHCPLGIVFHLNWNNSRVWNKILVSHSTICLAILRLISQNHFLIESIQNHALFHFPFHVGNDFIKMLLCFIRNDWHISVAMVAIISIWNRYKSSPFYFHLKVVQKYTIYSIKWPRKLRAHPPSDVHKDKVSLSHHFLAFFPLFLSFFYLCSLHFLSFWYWHFYEGSNT